MSYLTFSLIVIGLNATAAENDAAQYQRCLAQTALNADAALEAALTWAGEGGGAAADHCVAVALLKLGHAGEAAMRLEALAVKPGGHGNRLRAELLAQAGNAWLLLPDATRAHAAFTSAIALGEEAGITGPLTAAFHQDRARAESLLGDPQAARRDLGLAIGLSPTAMSYILRARILRDMKDYAAAAADIRQALILEPGHREALLERAKIRVARGETAAAREDFIAVALGGEDAITEDARRGLEALDLRL